MIKKIKIPKFILIACCLLTSVISINKLDALSANTYIRLNGSDTDLKDGYYTYFDKNTNLIFKSIYYLNDTGNLDYYITTSIIFCSSFGVNSVYNNESEFLVSTKIKDLGTCEFDGISGRVKQEVTWVQYLPVVNSNTQALGQVFIKFVNDKNWRLGVQIVSKTITVQSAGVYEQHQTNDKQDQTNDKLDDLNSSLKNSDVDTNDSFFSNFTTTDHGISGIITAPLRAINKLTSACQPVTFSVLDEPIELPCGDTLFWNKEGVQSFRLIWNILVGGPILFLLLKKLFKVVESLKNPDDDRIEVMDL